MVIKNVWGQLVDEDKVITGTKAPVIKNVQLLIKAVADEDKDL